MNLSKCRAYAYPCWDTFRRLIAANAYITAVLMACYIMLYSFKQNKL